MINLSGILVNLRFYDYFRMDIKFIVRRKNENQA